MDNILIGMKVYIRLNRKQIYEGLDPKSIILYLYGNRWIHEVPYKMLYKILVMHE